jgi:hypothetical protein
VTQEQKHERVIRPNVNLKAGVLFRSRPGQVLRIPLAYN